MLGRLEEWGGNVGTGGGQQCPQAGSWPPWGLKPGCCRLYTADE